MDDRFTRYGRAAAATAGIGAGLLGARALGVGLPCPMLSLTGVPCPACGMTRLADTVAHGRLTDAVTTDPAGLALLAVVAGLAVAYLFAIARHRPPPRLARITTAVPAVVFGALVAHWVTTLVTGGFVDS